LVLLSKAEFEVVQKKPNCMHFDPISKICFVGDSEGNIKVIDAGKVTQGDTESTILHWKHKGLHKRGHWGPRLLPSV